MDFHYCTHPHQTNAKMARPQKGCKCPFWGAEGGGIKLPGGAIKLPGGSSNYPAPPKWAMPSQQNFAEHLHQTTIFQAIKLVWQAGGPKRGMSHSLIKLVCRAGGAIKLVGGGHQTNSGGPYAQACPGGAVTQPLGPPETFQLYRRAGVTQRGAQL